MKTLNLITSALTGRTKHWVEHNNPYVNDLAQRTKQFPPAIQRLFLKFVAASYQVVEALVGPTMGKERIFKKELKSIGTREFRELHNMTIWGFLGLFAQQNPRLRTAFLVAGRDFIGITAREGQLVDSLIAAPKVDLGAIGHRLLDEYSRILRHEKDEVFGNFMLTTTFGTAYETAMKSYKDEFSTPQESPDAP